MDRLDYRRSRSRESYRSGGHRDSTPLAYSGAYRNHSSSRRRSRSYSRERGRHRSRSRDRRSRSRDRRSRSHDHRTRSQSHRSHSRDSRRSSRRRGGRGRSSSSSSSSSDSSDQLRRQREEEKQAKEILAARVFVCNLPYGSFTEADLRHMLDSHGKLKSVNMFVDRGYAFLQYETEADARIAVEEGRGSIWKGRKIDIKMAMEGRRDREGFARRPSPPPPMGLLPLSGVQRPDPDRPDSLTPGRLPRDRSPVRLVRDRSPLRDDRYRDPYRDLRDPPVRRDDPYYDDPYRRLPPPDDPYLDRLRDDRYRGLPPPPPRREPYVDPYLPPQRPLPPPECTVLLTEEQVRPYGELIIRKVKANGLVASIAVLPEDRTIPLAVEDMTRRGTLFAIVITSQNEVHSSVTLNILHGQPQEHRNMPLDDAMSLVARSFDRYVQSVREKAAPPPRPAPGPAPFITPEPGISYLLNLLADNRQLTVVELDKVISYLTERRNKLRGDPPVAESPAVTVAPQGSHFVPRRERG
ncbi:LOW QUALITY PROTEIN: nuclear receptor coactivator 5-like [Liolophura sinensis]|uniref:LOW QUALITY PROTEIN: nuclear receptor coactivator 5-like n=1 Tax=Liolophura sinensis TaxID=3198878 RepID=UPI00315804ED